MKKLGLLVSMCLLVACNLNGQWGKKVKGDGNIVTITRNVGSYDGIGLNGWFDVELVAGKEGEITLTGDENLLEHLVTEVENDGTLRIKEEKGYNLEPSSWKGKAILVTVPVESINDVRLSGSGDIEGKTRLSADKFSTAVSGSGDVSLEIDADELRTQLSGSGDINLKGKAKELKVQVSGSGDVKAFDLEAQWVDVQISGSADVLVTATETLSARVSGSGDVRYRGNPGKVDSKTSGSGDVTKE